MEHPPPQFPPPVSRPNLSREQRDKRRQIRSAVIMLLGTTILAAAAIWLARR